MRFTKAPPALIEIFDGALPGPPVTQRKMFGYPAAFINGNMFFGVFAEEMFVRLAEDDAAELNRCGGRAFEPMPGRPMRGYVVLPRSIVENRAKLRKWVARSQEYASKLPAKAASQRGSSRKPAKKRR
jgi:TfoX/Sxy family transcriptional regulator of competence genes